MSFTRDTRRAARAASRYLEGTSSDKWILARSILKTATRAGVSFRAAAVVAPIRTFKTTAIRKDEASKEDSIHVVHYEKGQLVEHDTFVVENKLVIPVVLVCRSPHHGTAKQPLLGGFAGDPRNIPLEQWAAMPPWFRDITPGSPEQWDECHLPELDDIEPLPLAYRSPWASISRASLAVPSRAMTIQERHLSSTNELFASSGFMTTHSGEVFKDLLCLACPLNDRA